MSKNIKLRKGGAFVRASRLILSLVVNMVRGKEKERKKVTLLS
jgi:hypothetical protein